MIRQKLDIHTFKRSGEVPPVDEEDWIMWQYEHLLLTETEAVVALATHRREEAHYDAFNERLQQVIAEKTAQKMGEEALHSAKLLGTEPAIRHSTPDA